MILRRTVVAALLLATTATRADDSPFRGPHGLFDKSPQDRSSELSIWAGLPWYYGYGLSTGVRYAMPLVKKGFLPKVNDSFELEFGGDYSYAGYGWYSINVLDAVAAGRWTLHLTSNFATYAKLGLGLSYVSSSATCGPYGSAQGYGPHYRGYGTYCSGVSPVVDGGVGILYNVSSTIALRAETTSFGLRGGVGFDF